MIIFFRSWLWIWVIRLLLSVQSYAADDTICEREDLPPVWYSESAKIFINALNLPQNNTKEDVSPPIQIANKQLLQNRQYEPVSPKDIIDIISFVDNVLAQGIITNSQITQSIEEAVSLSVVWKEIVENNFKKIRIFIAEAGIELNAADEANQADNKSPPPIDVSDYYQIYYYRLIATKIWPWLDNIKAKNSALYDTNAKVFRINYSPEKKKPTLSESDEKHCHMIYYGEDVILKYRSSKQEYDSKPLDVNLIRRMIQNWLEIYVFRTEEIMHHDKCNVHMGKPIWSFLYYIGIEQRYTLNFNEIHEGYCSTTSRYNIAAIVDIDDFIKFRNLMHYIPEILELINNDSITTLSSVLEADGKTNRKTEENHIEYWQEFAYSFSLILNPLCIICLDAREKYKEYRKIINTPDIVITNSKTNEPITTPALPKLRLNTHIPHSNTRSNAEKNALIAHINFMWYLKQVNFTYAHQIQDYQKIHIAHIMAAKFYNQ